VVSNYFFAIIALVAGFLAALNAHSAPPPAQDPDWPCQQRLVPHLAAAAYWNGPPLESLGDWRAGSEIAGLVRRLALRRDGAPAAAGKANPGPGPAAAPSVH
jgi:hypothetical protein